MSFSYFASRMFPYWMLGAFMFWSIWNSSYKELLNFDKKSFTKFFIFMLCVSVYRIIGIKIAIASGFNLSSLKVINSLPIGATLFTPWEDLCHSVPLVLLRKIIGTSKKTWPIHFLATAVVMIGFGMGHIYQGLFSAAFLSLYILFGIHYGQKKGFGTLMAGHALYDFLTILGVRIALMF